jgi:YD repeat-containing protein
VTTCGSPSAYRLIGADIQPSGKIKLTYDDQGLLTTIEALGASDELMDQHRLVIDSANGNRVSEFAHYVHGAMHTRTTKLKYDEATGFIASADILTGSTPTASGSISFGFDGEGRPASLVETQDGVTNHSINYSY